jgi:hypothetical protein
MTLRSRVRSWLEDASPAVFSTYAIVASFSAYFCMYGYRRPFAVGTYAGDPLMGLDPKTAYLIAQVLGYAAAKFAGIKVVSELTAERRAIALVATIGCAQAALVLFAISPPALAPVALALNGLSLGMVWGMVFGFLERRKTSDLLGAALCASFIVASGFVKTIGRQLLDAGIPERWMPASVGALFAPVMVLSILMLSCIPPPSAEDEAARTRRAPMGSAERREFFLRFAGGLVPLIAAYVLLTAYRDFRDSFARELWDAMGYAGQPSVLTTTEIPVAMGALLGVALINVVKDNRRALLAIHGMLVVGAILVLGATLLHRAGLIGHVTWMMSVGLGLYFGYVPFNCVLFDRLVAATGSVATAGFLIYVADAFGYAGSVGLLVWKSLSRPDVPWVAFLEWLGIASSLVVLALYVVSAAYFGRKTSGPPPAVASPA